MNPGFTLSASSDGINQVSDSIAPYIFEHFKTIALPDVSFPGGKMTHITTKIHEPESITEDLVFSLNPSQNSIIFTAKKLFTEMHGDFSYKFALIDIDGEAFVNVTDLDFQIEVQMDQQVDPTSGKMAPALKVVDVQINIDPKKIQIRLEGSLVAKIAELFSKIFKE